MGLDIRVPIGGMFSILGFMMLVYGVFTWGSEMYARSLGHNINLLWGLVMLIFGVLMLYFGVRKKVVPGPTGSGPAEPLPRAGGH